MLPSSRAIARLGGGIAIGAALALLNGLILSKRVEFAARTGSVAQALMVMQIGLLVTFTIVGIATVILIHFSLALTIACAIGFVVSQLAVLAAFYWTHARTMPTLDVAPSVEEEPVVSLLSGFVGVALPIGEHWQIGLFGQSKTGIWNLHLDTVLLTLLVVGVLVLLGIYIRTHITSGPPSRIQNAVESIIQFLNNIIEEIWDAIRAGSPPSR